MSRIIFLDFDGVLNSDTYFKALERPPIWKDTDRDEAMIDETRVALLEGLVKRAACEVVVSSSWRITRSLQKLRAVLGRKGFTGRIIATTPRLDKARGREIQAWIDAQKQHPDGIVILDDSADMVHLTPWLVRTDWGMGLTAEDVESALEVIARRAPPRTPGRGASR